MPVNPEKSSGDPVMCADAASSAVGCGFQRSQTVKLTNISTGITYMPVYATQRSDSDPYDKTSPPIIVLLHWMPMLWFSRSSASPDCR